MELSKGNDQNYFAIKYNKETHVLSFCMSEGLRDDMFPIRQHFPIQMLSATTEYKDIQTEDFVYPNCKIISIKVVPDECDFIFEAGKTILRQSIENSINHIEN